MIKKTKKLIKTLKPFWKQMEKARTDYFNILKCIETMMEKKTNIKGIEFFWCDDGIVGIGNINRTLELVHDNELEGD
jgi:hypothetical protein